MSANINDDKILLLALYDGNEKAFDIIFRKYFESIFRFIYYNCKSEADAQDLTQEVFVKLWQSRRAINILSLKSYLFSIAKNTVIDWTRQSVNKYIFENYIDESLFLQIELADVQDSVTDDMLQVIQNKANRMPARRLEVYKMRWIEGLSRKEIAEKLGITVTTVDIHLHKALEYLRLTVKSS